MNAQQLKNSILQMAIQGKLVPQDPNDEPASVLIERIREEKEKLIKEKKIKKEKNPSFIFRGTDNITYEKIGKNEPISIEDDLPFGIPGSWEWVRIHTISNPIGSKNNQIRSKEVLHIGKIPVVSQSKDLIDGYSNQNEKKINILPLVMFGDHTRNVKYIDFEFIIGADGTKFHQIIGCNPKYIFFWMQYAAETLRNRGYARHYSLLKEQYIPIPPLCEQSRIVDKLEELLPLVERYGDKQNSLDKLKNDFPVLLKKSILQEAVQGRLVPQDPSDEPASVLLERIRAEKQRLIKEGKIKKDKNESIIYRRDNSHYEKLNDIERCIDDEIPFEIPESWEWVRLGTIFQHNTGKALNASKTTGTKLTYITTSNLYWDKFSLDNLREMPFTESELEKCTVSKGDLLVCEGGDIGRSAIWNNDYPIRIQNHIHRLRGYTVLNMRFYYFIFYFYKHISLIGGKGIGIKGLSSNALHMLLFPLPPIEEQDRIVSKIDSLLPKIEQL
ncbi:MAG TPA: restriction endonuclease subunit S [Candidatus Merdenecus merdavium]|nr:restriction endonuclease subunit S [Candidatus Merdenecus merdavium]